MGRFVYSMNVSIDLRIEQVPGDDGAGEWLRIDEEFHRAANEFARAAAAIVHGRRYYETMEDFRVRSTGDDSVPDFLRDYGQIWADKPKVLVSRSRATAGHGTRVVGTDVIEWLAAYRAVTEGRIAVGGASLATQLLRAGLLDELLLWTHPSYLGFGRSLFDDYDRPLDLELLDDATFASGVTVRHYSIRHEGSAR